MIVDNCLEILEFQNNGCFDRHNEKVFIGGHMEARHFFKKSIIREHM